MTELLHFQFSLSCIEEGNGNLLQCSCLESPRDGGAWWAAVYGIAQSRTQLKRLSSSSSSIWLKYWGPPMLSAYIFIIVYFLLGLILWSLYSVLLCLFPWPLFQSLFYMIWELLLLLYFGLHLHEIFFSSPSLSVCICPLFWSGSLVDSIYGSLVFVSIHPVFVFCLELFPLILNQSFCYFYLNSWLFYTHTHTHTHTHIYI